jgi:hypothetical protein
MSQRHRDHLPPPLEIPLLGSRTGNLLLRPWFDRVTIRWVTRLFFPMSRGWAAAGVAAGSQRHFAKTLGLRTADLPRAATTRLLNAVHRTQLDYRAARAEWLETFYADAEPAQERLAAAESARERAAQAYMATRAYAFPIHVRQRLPGVAFSITAPDTVAAAHAHRLNGPATRFPPPADPEMRQTHRVGGGYGEVSWLGWPSPGAGDTAWARVYTPTDVKNPPTLIHLHGLGMEMEMWRAQRDPVNALARDAGIRVIRPEGPWHGSRMMPGYHGGEPVMAFAPEGYLDYLQTWVAEAAQLIRWARATSTGPVLIGGLSLGALTAQIIGTVAAWWPRELQADAMFLVATSGDMVEVGFEGAFAQGFGLGEKLHEHGWTHDKLVDYRTLMEPQGPPVMPPERVVMLLGRKDAVTPYSGGLALARQWHLPAENVFVRNRGHFSTPLGLHQDPSPLHRAVEVLRASV